MLRTRFPNLMRVALASSIAVATTTHAQEPAAAKPATKPAAVAPTTTPAVLPEIRMQGIGFSDVIDFLRDVDPKFQAVVSYAPGVIRGEPVIQELNLKDVTAEVVLRLLCDAYPQINVEPNDFYEDGQVVYSIRVNRPEGEEEDEDASAQPVTTVLRLREIVDELSHHSAEAAERKKALDSVLSLLQAALEAQRPAAVTGRPGDGGVLLRVHEATEMLVFKGSPKASNLVDAALLSLLPPPTGSDPGKLERENKALKDEVESLRKRLGGGGAAGEGLLPGSPGEGAGVPASKATQPK